MEEIKYFISKYLFQMPIFPSRFFMSYCRNVTLSFKNIRLANYSNDNRHIRTNCTLFYMAKQVSVLRMHQDTFSLSKDVSPIRLVQENNQAADVERCKAPASRSSVIRYG